MMRHSGGSSKSGDERSSRSVQAFQTHRVAGSAVQVSITSTTSSRACGSPPAVLRVRIPPVFAR